MGIRIMGFSKPHRMPGATHFALKGRHRLAQGEAKTANAVEAQPWV